MAFLSWLELKIPPVVLVLLMACLMYVSALCFPSVTLQWELSLMFSLILGTASITLAVIAVLLFRKNSTTVNPITPKATTSLVSNGVFQISRNPMYLAMLGMLVAWGIWLENIVALLIVWAFIPYMNRFQIIAEERSMQEIFGKEYLDYCKRVRRWL